MRKLKKPGWWEEFTAFAIKGNAMALAVGTIIGAAFSGITKSLTDDVIMPIVGAIVGGINFANLKIVIRPAEGDLAEAAICYGNFIQAIVNFLIVAFVLFCVVKAMNKLKKKEEAPAPEPPKPSEEVLLLREIRDALKENK